jgi:uncharacterized protein (DUF433 family)
MNTLDQAAELVARMSAGEKVELLHLVAGQLGDAQLGIDHRPEVCGGEACIVRTRIPVWILEQARRLGATEIELLRSYPTLRAADLVNAWAYVSQHPEEIDSQIHATEEA